MLFCYTSLIYKIILLFQELTNLKMGNLLHISITQPVNDSTRISFYPHFKCNHFDETQLNRLQVLNNSSTRLLFSSFTKRIG